MSVTITSSSNDITVSCLALDILFDDFDNGVKVNTGTVHLILWKNAMSVLFQRSLILHTKKRTMSGEDRSVTQLILQLLKRNHRSISEFNVYVLCRKPRNLRDLFWTVACRIFTELRRGWFDAKSVYNLSYQWHVAYLLGLSERSWSKYNLR